MDVLTSEHLDHASPGQAGDLYGSVGAPSVESISTFDEYDANPRFRALQSELRSLLFTGAISAAPTRAPTPEPDELPLTPSGQIPGHRLLLQHLSQSGLQIPFARKVQYLQAWISECAPWLDMFDQRRHFGIHVPLLAQRSPAVLYAVLAHGARQVERHRGLKGSHDSLQLYQESITSLTTILDDAQDPNVLVTACILCCLEMMSVSPRDWRRHVEGCAALFEAFGVNGFSGGLLQAVFWCYARMDLCGAIIADGSESTVLPISKWVLLDPHVPAPPTPQERDDLVSRIFLEQSHLIPDMHANYAVYLCAKSCDLLNARTRSLELGEANGCHGKSFQEAWEYLWHELQTWLDRRPPEMHPVRTVPATPPLTSSPTSSSSTTTTTATTDKHLFPAILFAHWAAISSNQLYHTACILMLEIKPPSIPLPPPPNPTHPHPHPTHHHPTHLPLWHARRTVGISLTNPHRGCWNNAIQPLYVAGKLFSHPEEHRAIVGLINDIERATGWGSRWRIKDLEAAWGYEVGTFTS